MVKVVGLLLILSIKIIGIGAQDSGTSSSDICTADANNTFHMIYDPYASETGYYQIVECGNTVQPVIGMKRNITYTFTQTDSSNWFHPVGFAYFADGAHREVDELEPGISQSGSDCVDSFTCQAPRYFINGEFVGIDYDNSMGVGGEDFGLDVYEPDFKIPREDWLGNEYTVELTLTDFDYDADIFYFCHIHNDMSARIKILDDDGNAVQEADEPEIPYEYYQPSEFDKICGTFDTEAYTRESGACAHDKMFCTVDGMSDEVTAFADCMYALDCYMDNRMRVEVDSDDMTKFFMDQMIPHHINAVNMAKTLLIRDLELEDEITDLLWDIINTQNSQITVMRNWLESNGYTREPTSNCFLENDSTSWVKNGGPAFKTCEWVGDLLRRCGVKGEDGTTACESCPATCGGSEFCA